jgi:hypothetical protein
VLPDQPNQLPNGTYFADWVLPSARDQAGEIKTETTVQTTLDRKMQRAAGRIAVTPVVESAEWRAIGLGSRRSVRLRRRVVVAQAAPFGLLIERVGAHRFVSVGQLYYLYTTVAARGGTMPQRTS